MKNFFLVIFCMTLFTTYAQTEMHNMSMGGNININYARQDSTFTFTMGINPQVGYFVYHNLLLGAQFGIGITSDNKGKGRVGRFYLNTLFTPYARYFIGKKNLRGLVEIKGGVIGSTSIIKASVGNADGWVVTPSAGIAYFFNKNLAMETTLYYSAVKVSRQNLTQNFGVALGLNYYFNPKKKEKLGE